MKPGFQGTHVPAQALYLKHDQVLKEFPEIFDHERPIESLTGTFSFSCGAKHLQGENFSGLTGRFENWQGMALRHIFADARLEQGRR